MASRQDSRAPVPLSRADAGRWLGGVCAGLAQIRGLGVRWLRFLFALAALLGGLGIAVYLTCWLIIPAGGNGTETDRPSGAVVLAQACAGCAGLAALAVIGATATVFGFGWIVAGLAAAILVGVLAGWRRLGPGWALLPIAALALPAIAVATSGLRLAPRTGHSVVAPVSMVRGPRVYRSGLDTMLVDLRRTAFPAGGTVPLRIEAGVRRTIVALPEHSCVRVVVHYHVNRFAVRLAALLSGRTAPAFSDVVLFGRQFGTLANGAVFSIARVSGPVLAINFSSQGGSLYVRDYPTDVSADLRPDWPGYPVHPEQRPNTKGVPSRAARTLLRNWRTRLAVELRSADTIDSLLPGPCSPPVTAPRSAPPVRSATARHR